MAQKLKIDKELLNRAEAHAAKTGYASLSEFVTHLLERELAGTGDSADAADVKKRLQGLGYID